MKKRYKEIINGGEKQRLPIPIADVWEKALLGFIDLHSGNIDQCSKTLCFLTYVPGKRMSEEMDRFKLILTGGAYIHPSIRRIMDDYVIIKNLRKLRSEILHENKILKKLIESRGIDVAEITDRQIGGHDDERP